MAPGGGPRRLRTGSVHETGWTELADEAGARGPGLPGEIDEVLAVIAHLSDLHICDAESPARQEYLDRHGHEGSPYATVLGDIGTYRPQEVLTVPVAIAMIEAINAVEGGPGTGEPLDAVVITGDLTDNAQANELAWCRSVLAGGMVTPASGAPGRSGWVGAPDAAWSEFFWHPEGHRSGRWDRWLGRHGFPHIDGLVEATRGTFRSPGLRAAHFAVHGNHDALLQGTVPADDALRALAVGSRRIIDLAPAQTPLAVREAVPGIGPARYLHTPDAPFETVTPDPRRRLVRPDDFVDALRPTGATIEPGPARCYRAMLNERVALLAVDTVNPHGGWEGSLGRAEYEWLRTELAAADEARTEGRFAIVASHHPSWCLINAYRPVDAEERVLGDAVLDALLASRSVVAWLSGHVHHHRITMHRRHDRVLPEFTAASCIDWPQQSRLLEIATTKSGGLLLCSTAVDHGAPAAARSPNLADVRHLASLSRTLSRNAPTVRQRLSIDEQANRRIDWSSFDRVVRIPFHGRGWT